MGGYDSEPLLQVQCRLSKRRGIPRIAAKHIAGKIDCISMGMAAKTEEDPASEVSGERRRPTLSLTLRVTGQRANTRSAVSPDLELNVVAPQDVDESQPAAELLEIHPSGVHGTISFR